MDVKAARGRSSNVQNEEGIMDFRRGPWTVDEDFTLINYITNHGEGRWNSLARAAGKYTETFPHIFTFCFFMMIFLCIPPYMKLFLMTLST